MSVAAGMPGIRAGSNCRMKRAAVYQCRRPERSAAYQVVRQNLETWLAQRRAGRLAAGADWVVDPVPGYVERDLRKFLECGVLAHGLARARCEKCGQDFFGSVFMQGARGVPGLQHTAHGGDGGAHGGACVSSSGIAAVGGGISKAPALLFGP